MTVAQMRRCCCTICVRRPRWLIHFSAALKLRLKSSAIMFRASLSDAMSPFSDSTPSLFASPQASTASGELVDTFFAPSLSLCRCVRQAARAGWVDDVENLNLQAGSTSNFLCDSKTFNLITRASFSSQSFSCVSCGNALALHAYSKAQYP